MSGRQILYSHGGGLWIRIQQHDLEQPHI